MKTVDANTLNNIINACIGNIQPTGDTSLDDCAYKNLQEYLDLFDSMFWEIQKVARFNSDDLASRKKMGADAFNYLKELRDIITVFLKEDQGK